MGRADQRCGEALGLGKEEMQEEEEGEKLDGIPRKPEGAPVCCGGSCGALIGRDSLQGAGRGDAGGSISQIKGSVVVCHKPSGYFSMNAPRGACEV